MRKMLICVFLVATLVGMSCKSGPKTSGASIDGEVTQAKVNDALGKIYDAYRSKLDMSGAQEYTVKSGDTLSEITRRYYGDLSGVGNAGPHNGFYFPLIMLASGHTVVDPDLVEPGMRLRIPDLKKNLDNSTSRKAIRDCISDVSYVYNRKNHPGEEEGLKKLAGSL
jgi:LysM repeat protein